MESLTRPIMSYCGLNNVKHRAIIDMVGKGLIVRFEEPWGNKTIISKVSEKEGRFFKRYWSHMRYCSQEGSREKTNDDGMMMRMMTITTITTTITTTTGNIVTAFLIMSGMGVYR